MLTIYKYNFFKLVFLLIQASKCFVFGQKSVLGISEQRSNTLERFQ